MLYNVRPITITLPNDALSKLSYDAAGNLLSIVHEDDGGSVIGSYSYTYDGSGRRVGAVETGTTITYTYDALYRLTDAVESTGSVYHYEYDAAGNRLLKQEPGVNQAAAYDAANQLVTVGGMSAVYDDNGNLLDDGTQTYQYDSLDQLIRVTQGISVTAYGYTGDGDRLWQNTDGVTTTFTLDLNSALTQVLAQSQGGQTSRFLPGIGQETNGVWAYYHSDALGSVRHLTGMAGTNIGSVKYSPFGEIANSTGMAAWYGFTGEQQDGTNGLTYLRARYYNPALGRFLTPDSLIPDVTNGQALNQYAYVYNDPINLVDPSGNIPDSWVNWYIGTVPGNKKDQIRHTWESGLDLLDWWYNEPDDCDCSQTQGGSSDVWLTGANYFIQGYWGGKVTTAVRMVGTHSVDFFSTNSWTWMEGVGTAVKVTGWSGVRAPNVRTFLTGSFKVTRSQGLTRQVVEHVHPEWVPGIKGLLGGVAGSGIIDGFFQLASDLINGLCASLAQWFNRVALAMLFGAAAGAAGAFAAAAAVGLGAAAWVAATTGVATGFILSYIYGRAKEAMFITNPDLFGKS